MDWKQESLETTLRRVIRDELSQTVINPASRRVYFPAWTARIVPLLASILADGRSADVIVR